MNLYIKNIKIFIKIKNVEVINIKSIIINDLISLQDNEINKNE